MAIEYSDTKKKSRLFGTIFFFCGEIVLLFKSVPSVKLVMAFVLVPVFLIGFFFTLKKIKSMLDLPVFALVCGPDYDER